MALTAHPMADLFPALANGEFQALKNDIAENGLLEPIWLYDGLILDGRNRYRACTELGIEPETREYKGESPAAFVWSLNGARRHLTSSQRAAIAAEMLPFIEEEARGRMTSGKNQYGSPVEKMPQGSSEDRANGRARDIAAQITGTNARYVSDAKRLKREDGEAFERVKRGEQPLRKAVATLPTKQERQPPTSLADSSPEMRAKRIDTTRRMAEGGYTSQQIANALNVGTQTIRGYAKEHDIRLPDEATGKSRRLNANRVIEQTAFQISGIAQGIDAIRESMEDIDTSQVGMWRELIDEAMPSINWLRRQLKEVANGEEG